MVAAGELLDNVIQDRPEDVDRIAHLKFREEGVRERYLHIEGDWRDHRTFALTVDDLGGLPTIERWHLPG